jgi:hypothetical protein
MWCVCGVFVFLDDDMLLIHTTACHAHIYYVVYVEHAKETVCVRVCVVKLGHTCIHICTEIHTYAYIHTYMHT